MVRIVVSLTSYRLRELEGDARPSVILAACSDGTLWYRRSDWGEAKPWRAYEPNVPLPDV